MFTVDPPPLSYGERARYRWVDQSLPPRSGTRWFELVAARWQPDRGVLQIEGSLDRLVEGTVSWFADPDQVHRVRFALRLEPGEHVAGFGERFDRLDQRGHRIDAVVYEQYKDQGATGRTYFPMPFAHVIGGGGGGWGFHVATSRRVWFDVGASQPDRLWVEVATGGAAWSEVSVQLFSGTPAQVLLAFLQRTGMPAEQPDWVYRLWISGNEWNTQDRVMERVDRHSAEDIPFGVLVIEAWSDESTFCFFRDSEYAVHEDGSPHRLAEVSFPADGAWPDPAAMVRDLHRRGVKVMLWQIPLQKMKPVQAGQAAADVRRMLEDGFCVREADGRPYRNRGWWFPDALMPDLTNPRARSWWQDKRRYLVNELGVDGFKTDGGEHAWADDLRYDDGTRGDASNNLYPVHYAETYTQLLSGLGRAPVVFSRAGHTGAQAYGCHWAGDESSTWAAFRSSVLAGITAGLGGVVHWGWDIGGFSGEIPDAELYLRATAAACFMPIMQYHAEFNYHRSPSRDRTPWNIAERHLRPDVLAEFRRFAQLRELLVPYLSTQAAAGIAVGKPLMRALAFEVADDPQIWQHPTQFFLGDDLLVAPMLEPGSSVDAYLPAGEWIDLFSGQQQPAGLVTRRTPTSEAAVYVRAPAWSRFAAVHGAWRSGFQP